MTNDLSIDLYLHKELKLHRGHIQFLYYFYEGTPDLLPKHKFTTDLVKGGYVYDDAITLKGRDLISEMENWNDTYVPNGKIKRKVTEFRPEFLEWWATFPASDNFEYNGQAFTGVQSKRTEKEACSVLYEEAIHQYTPEVMLRLLKYEVEARMDESIMRKANQIHYMPGTLPYLRKKTYEAFLPLIARGPYRPKSEQQNQVVKTTVAF